MPPLRLDLSHFCWATGIENTFIPQTCPGKRALDEYDLTQHYQLWKSDLDLVAETGIQAVRWGIPWYRVQPEPKRWDWSWTDQVLDYLVTTKGLTPILDLMHYGTPLWLENSFIDPSYPERVAEYAQAVAARYKNLVHYYTPLNEPAINAHMCGRAGEWPPYLQGDAGYVKVMLALAKGIVLTVKALQAEQPDMQTVQVEAFWRFRTREATLLDRITCNHAQQYLSLDLTTGRFTDTHLLLPFLQEHGVTEHELTWFQENAVTFDFLGANFYPWSCGEQLARKNGSLYRKPGHASGMILAEVLAEVYARYNLPLLVTETSSKGSPATRGRWMDETVNAVHYVRSLGVPVVGYTWFPFFTMLDWAYRPGHKPLEKYLIHLGLYDGAFDADGTLQRSKTPLVTRFQRKMLTPMPAVAPLSHSMVLSGLPALTMPLTQVPPGSAV